MTALEAEPPATPARRAELREALARVEERIERACANAGRSRAEVTLVVVTKFFPASDVDALAGLGIRAIGEARDQEASTKLAAVTARDDLEVHFVGQLQSKKSGSVARYADVVHSLDRRKLVGALGRGAAAAGREITALVQVSLDDAPGRGGARVEEVPELADAVAASGLRLGGVMAVAPQDADPGASFARLAEVAARVRADHPEARWVSAGMSADLEEAVAHGATHLRVGTAILGSRPPHR